MRYAKYISESRIEMAPRVFFEGDVYIANPPEEVILAHGYKPLMSDPEPEIGENKYLEERYEDTADAVLKHWTVVEVEEPEEPAEQEAL